MKAVVVKNNTTSNVYFDKNCKILFIKSGILTTIKENLFDRDEYKKILENAFSLINKQILLRMSTSGEYLVEVCVDENIRVVFSTKTLNEAMDTIKLILKGEMIR